MMGSTEYTAGTGRIAGVNGPVADVFFENGQLPKLRERLYVPVGKERRIMEVAPCEELYNNALHPYTQALLSAIPIADPEVESKREIAVLQGEVPSITRRPSGCPFHNRCPKATPRCSQELPQLHDVGGDHQVACFLY